jgi:pre-mRNA-splicing factor ATP-dependent RNA helicase DHX16
MTNDNSKHAELMAKLREESRRKYLPKRKDDKIYELKRQLEEDELYFPEAELTERERIERKRKRQVIQAAEKYEQAGSILTTQRYHISYFHGINQSHFRYHMPGEKMAVFETITEEKDLPGGDGRRWEDERLHTAIFQVGAKDAKVCSTFSSVANSFKFQHDGDLDLLLDVDERVDFIQAFQIKGQNEEVYLESQHRFNFPFQKKPQLTATQKKKLTLAEVRKSLPVYGFREQFLQAVEENQVLIICGETGSGKTTQLPQYLYEAGYCKDGKRIGCTQPRRVAAMSVASKLF